MISIKIYRYLIFIKMAIYFFPQFPRIYGQLIETNFISIRDGFLKFKIYYLKSYKTYVMTLKRENSFCGDYKSIIALCPSKELITDFSLTEDRLKLSEFFVYSLHNDNMYDYDCIQRFKKYRCTDAPMLKTTCSFFKVIKSFSSRYPIDIDKILSYAD